MESGRAYAGRVFVDATYEGDLMAKAGVSYHVGREANAVYGETLNGVQTRNATSHQFKVRVDPYVVPGDPRSGLLPGLHDGGPGEEGSGDRRVQAYNFRMTLTDAPANRLPIPRPEGYDPRRYELLRRYVEAGVFDAIDLNSPMPNRKTDVNNHGAFSSDHIGANYEYPDADHAARERIFRDHVVLRRRASGTSSRTTSGCPRRCARRPPAGACAATSSRTPATGRTSSTSARPGG